MAGLNGIVDVQTFLFFSPVVFAVERVCKHLGVQMHCTFCLGFKQKQHLICKATCDFFLLSENVVFGGKNIH